MKIVMDSDVLIKLAKTSLKEAVMSALEVSIPPEVQRECVDEGKAGGFPDAVRVEANIREGRLAVRGPQDRLTPSEVVKDLRLARGEADVFRLFRSGGHDAVASDDRRFLQTLETLGIPFVTSSALLLALVRRDKLTVREARDYLERLAAFIGEDEYVLARSGLEELG